VGTLQPDDAYSVAVVGTRHASPDGLVRAEKLAGRLVAEGVTVLSGLARGIDTAAHEGCLAAGGRTIAVLGSGIRRVYPPENAALARRITASGALVSQFWPDAPPASHTFPRRNVVMSGMGQGTIVVEASETSGAKMQARLAIEHGKQVFLLASLVADRPWARWYLARPGVVEVSEVRDIIRALRSPAQVQDRRNHAIAMRSGPLRRAIDRYKVHGRWGWALIFGRVLAGFLDREAETFGRFDLIVASPTYVGTGGRAFNHTRLVLEHAAPEVIPGSRLDLRRRCGASYRQDRPQSLVPRKDMAGATADRARRSGPHSP
jgi:DNA protecting protein DprA